MAMNRAGELAHQPVVVVVADADENAGGSALKTVWRQGGVLQAFPNHFEHEPLLRIGDAGLVVGHAEELVIEAIDIVEIAAPGEALRAGRHARLAPALDELLPR